MWNRFVSFLLVGTLFLALPAARAEENMSVAGKRAKIVAKSAVYGFGGGLVVGLASQVFKRKTKNIFLFGSLGLYAGIILGIYVVSSSSGPAPYEAPDTYDDFGWNKPGFSPALARAESRSPQNELQWNFLNLEF